MLTCFHFRKWQFSLQFLSLWYCDLLLAFSSNNRSAFRAHFTTSIWQFDIGSLAILAFNSSNLFYQERRKQREFFYFLYYKGDCQTDRIKHGNFWSLPLSTALNERYSEITFTCYCLFKKQLVIRIHHQIDISFCIWFDWHYSVPYNKLPFTADRSDRILNKWRLLGNCW